MASLSTRDWIAREPKILAQKSANLVKKALVKDRKGGEVPSVLSQARTITGIEFGIPDALLKGTNMTKVSGSGHKKKVFQLDPDEGRILYNKSGKLGVGRCPASCLYILSLFSVSPNRDHQRDTHRIRCTVRSYSLQAPRSC